MVRTCEGDRGTVTCRAGLGQGEEEEEEGGKQEEVNPADLWPCSAEICFMGGRATEVICRARSGSMPFSMAGATYAQGRGARGKAGHGGRARLWSECSRTE